MKLNQVASMYLHSTLTLMMACSAGYSQNPQEVSANDGLVIDVVKAWELRNSRLKTIDIAADLEEKTLGTDAPPSNPGDPFGEHNSERDQLAKVKLKYLQSGERVKLGRHSDRVYNGKPNAEYVSQLLLLSFDGKSNFQLIEQATRIPMGEIDKSPKAIHRFNVHIDFAPIYLWQHPTKVLQAVGWNCAGMSTDGTVHEIDGISCLSMEIPRRNNKAWTSLLYVDPAREYVPVKWQTFFHGRPMKTFSIGYMVNAANELVIKNWELVDCDEAGIVEAIRTGTVTSSKLNSQIDIGRFDIKFPIGTHVIEKDGAVKKFYIQDKDGLVPIEPEEYGRRKRTISLRWREEFLARN
jgi:hypothetical protein